MDVLKIAEYIPQNCCVSKEDILEIAYLQQIDIKESSVFWLIRQLIESGILVRTGRNHYCRAEEAKKRREYSYCPSEYLSQVVDFLEKEYPLMEFQAWEAIQFNYFVNHQIAHNTLFVEVENMLQGSVYESLRDKFGGKVLLKPSVDIYTLYAENNTIVVLNLVSETPSNKRMAHRVLLEKLLVDMMCNKLIPMFVPKSEYADIYEEAFSKYVIDETKLFRYARRRNAEKRLRTYLKEETKAQIITEGRDVKKR